MTIARLMQQAAAGSAGAGPEPSGWIDPDLANASYDSVSFSVAGQETSPLGINFNNDGTKAYIVGPTTDRVYEYPLSTAWDLSTASYNSVSFSVAPQNTVPSSVAFNSDGTKMYITGIIGSIIYQYSLSTGFDISTASYDSISFDVSSQVVDLVDLSFSYDGTKLYALSFGSDTVYQYSLSTGFDISTASYDSVSFSVTAQERDPTALKFNPDGTKMYVCGIRNYTVYQYSLSSVFDVSTASYDSVSFSVAAQLSNPRGFTFKSDGSKMYVVGVSNDTIYQYSTAAAAPSEWIDPDLANASYDSVSFSVAGQDTSPISLSFSDDGTEMYVLGEANDYIVQYSLSTAWDITSAASPQTFSVSSQETVPTGLFFKPDGTKMYVIGVIGDNVNEYDLSTAWDISTASYLQNFSISAQETAPQALWFKGDGAKMYVTGAAGDDVNEYDLSTAWDVSSASYVQNFSIASQETVPRALAFNPDGTKMFVMGSGTDAVYEYPLSIAWDVSTASYSSVSFSVASQETNPCGLFFKSDGSKMYVVGFDTDTIYQYSTD